MTFQTNMTGVLYIKYVKHVILPLYTITCIPLKLNLANKNAIVCKLFLNNIFSRNKGTT